MKKTKFCLTGFMGAGKTTVGCALADRLALPFFDLDVEIERGEGRTIPDIFSVSGEAFFRDLEVTYLRRLPAMAVIALGGGAYTTQAVRDHILEQGLAIYLDWPFEILLERVAGDPNRPLAIDAERLAALYERRRPIYLQADLVWQSYPPYHESVEDIVADLAERLPLP